MLTSPMNAAAWLLERLPIQLAANRWRPCRGGWSRAGALTAGYDHGEILDKVRAATRRVAADPGLWERDSVVFEGVEPHWQILSSLLLAWPRETRPMRVVDFGGSLGSLWWRHRGLLASRGEVRWTVVEQEAFVAAGAEFADGNLSFRTTLPGEGVDVLLASCVLNYLEDPHGTLGSFGGSDAEWLLLDRVPVVEAQEDRLMIQTVHPRIYRASYPCWFFSRRTFEADLDRDWERVAGWEERLRSLPGVDWIGGLHRRRRRPGLEAAA